MHDDDVVARRRPGGTRTSSSRLIALLLVPVAFAVVACGGDDSPATTTTARSSTSSTTTGAPATQPDTAVWPFASSTTRFRDPVAAATSFAVTFLGFVDPVVGGFQQGDTRSGEVPVRANPGGPVTTVLVRQVTTDDSWWVLGASTPNLQIETPSTPATISSPVTLSGRSTAFEATVNVQVRQDDTLTPLQEGTVMGGANGQMAPFSTDLSFPAPTAAAGAIVLMTLSAENGHVAEASVIRVHFAPPR